MVQGQYQGFDTDCTGSSCPGACCVPGEPCLETTLDDCDARGGVYQGLEGETLALVEWRIESSTE